MWMLVERIDARKAYGAAWQQVASRLPRGRFSARRVTVDIEAVLNGSRHVIADTNPGLTGARSVHSLVTDDEDYSGDDARRARLRFETCISVEERGKVADVALRAEAGFDALAAMFGTTAFTATHREALRHAWLPVGLGAGFDYVATAVPQERDALARDGLSLFDDTLFLDPALADTRVSQIMPVIEQIRDIDEASLTGIHAGLDAPDHAFGIASIFAVPDAAQPGWEEVRAAGLPAAATDAPDRADWYDHKGGCAAKLPEDQAAYRTEPDRSRFLDCSTRLIAAPNLSGPRLAVRDGTFTLNWSGGDVGATFVLEEAGSADFTGAVEIYRGTDETIDLTRMREGAYYYRLYAELGGNVSYTAPSAYSSGKAVSRLLPLTRLCSSAYIWRLSGLLRAPLICLPCCRCRKVSGRSMRSAIAGCCAAFRKAMAVQTHSVVTRRGLYLTRRFIILGWFTAPTATVSPN